MFFSLQLLCVFNARSYSCSILIETVGACQEKKNKKRRTLFPRFNAKITEKRALLFSGAGKELDNLKSGLRRVALFVLRVIDVTLLLFLPLVRIIMTSQRALLVVYISWVLFVCAVPNTWVHKGRARGNTGLVTQSLKLPYNHMAWCSPAPVPPGGGVIGKRFIWIYFKNDKEKKESTAYLSADCLFNQLHKNVQ